jgi:hypothetical protein
VCFAACDYISVTQSDSRRLRLLFKTGDDYRQFCKVEQRGDDLYWFPSQGKTVKGVAGALDQGVWTTKMPDEIEIVDNQH